MTLKEMLPLPTERALIVGATGTGKTTLARAMLRHYPRVLVIDPKCTYDPEDKRYKMVRSLSALRLYGNRPFLHFRPTPGTQGVEVYDQIYRWAYLKRNIMVYTDETFLTMRYNQSPDWQRAIVTCGRELGVGAIFATQRPSGIDLRLYTESERRFCFRLENVDDRKRMAEALGKIALVDPVDAAMDTSEGGTPEEWEHAFWYRYVRERKTRLAQLHLSEE